MDLGFFVRCQKVRAKGLRDDLLGLVSAGDDDDDGDGDGDGISSSSLSSRSAKVVTNFPLNGL